MHEELFLRDGRPAGVWYCSECRVVYAVEALAQRCHGKASCESCGESLGERVPYYKTKCDTCDRAEWIAKQKAAESERFASAEKLQVFDGAVFLEGVGSEFFESLDDLVEYLEDDDPEVWPGYCWACADNGAPAATTEDITERLTSEMWEDADENDLNGMPELIAAVDAFNLANQSIHVWHPDYTKAVLIARPATS